jgi:hypothetical protein
MYAVTSAFSSGVRIRFGIFGCELLRKTRMAVAVSPWYSQYRGRMANLDHSLRRLVDLELMADLASFACESMTSRNIPILHFRAEGRCGQSGCEGRGMSRLSHYYSH